MTTRGQFRVLSRELRKGRRPYMEDYVYDGRTLAAVLDGHGGRHTAAYVSAHLPKYMEALLANAHRRQHTDDVIKEAVRRKCTVMQEYLRVGEDAALYASSGSTCCMAGLLGDGRLAVINLGDSRCVVVRDGRRPVVFASKDHTGETDAARIGRRTDGSAVEDGRLVQGDVSLAPARGFGNLPVSAFISRPQIKLLTLVPGARYVVVLATDGVWDVIDSEEIGTMVERGGGYLEAGDLVKEAYKRGSGDNISAVVCEYIAPR